MLLNTDYLFDFNKTRYKEIYEFSLPQREDLSVHCYEDAVILPARADDKTLFGRGGGNLSESVYSYFWNSFIWERCAT